jgi:hypothetical protein
MDGATMEDMTIEPIVVRALAGPDELDLFLQLSYVLDDELVEDLERGRRRPEWMWVALRGAHLVARLAWWTATDGCPPLFLDLFDLDDTLDDADRIDIGLKLLNAATAEVLPAGVPRPEYGRFTPPDWREDPVARRMVEGRIRVMEKTGARLLVDDSAWSGSLAHRYRSPPWGFDSAQPSTAMNWWS